jgi:hypothetical protein
MAAAVDRSSAAGRFGSGETREAPAFCLCARKTAPSPAGSPQAFWASLVAVAALNRMCNSRGTGTSSELFYEGWVHGKSGPTMSVEQYEVRG